VREEALQILNYLTANEEEYFTLERLSYLIDKCETVARLSMVGLCWYGYAQRHERGWQVDHEYLRLLNIAEDERGYG